MRRKAQQSNRSFMLGTLVLGILVMGVVILFTALAFDMHAEKEQEAKRSTGDSYHFRLSAGFYPSGCDMYLNDSLIYSGIVTTDTIISVARTADDNTVLVVDHSTDHIQLTELSEKRGKYHLIIDQDELQAIEE